MASTQVFGGSAQGLAELTREFWAAEWWPNGLMFHPCGRWCYEDHGSYRNVGEVAAAIFAAAMVHLAEHDLLPGLSKITTNAYDDGLDWEVFMRGPKVSSRVPDPLHAAIAAIKAIA